MEKSSGESCAICLDEIKEKGMISGCTHIFCYECILEWSKSTNVCPVCRSRFLNISKINKKTKKNVTKNVLEKNLQLEDDYFYYEEDEEGEEENDEEEDEIDESFIVPDNYIEYEDSRIEIISDDDEEEKIKSSLNDTVEIISDDEYDFEYKLKDKIEEEEEENDEIEDIDPISSTELKDLNFKLKKDDNLNESTKSDESIIFVKEIKNQKTNSQH
jgi:hypothetical protein